MCFVTVVLWSMGVAKPSVVEEVLCQSVYHFFKGEIHPFLDIF